MKRGLLALSLIAIIFNAEAHWTKLPFTDSTVDQYIDPTRIDNKRKPYPALWVLVDFRNEVKKNAFGKLYKSHIILYDIDCISRKLKIGVVYYYQNGMGEGQVVDTLETNMDKFITPPPYSPGEFYIKLVCSFDK